MRGQPFDALAQLDVRKQAAAAHNHALGVAGEPVSDGLVLVRVTRHVQARHQRLLIPKQRAVGYEGHIPAREHPPPHADDGHLQIGRAHV